MKKFWKKPVLKITATAVIVVALASLGLWILSLRSPQEVSFKFLNGHAVTGCVRNHDGDSHYSRIIDIYTFKADVDEICKAAEDELTARGFEVAASVSQRPGERHYTRVGILGDSMTVHIDADNGFVTIVIPQTRLRFWPPHHLLYALKMRFNSALQKP